MNRERYRFDNMIDESAASKRVSGSNIKKDDYPDLGFSWF
jgi:hypothetical protein